MSVRLRLKHFAERLPPGVGRIAARVPFSIRLGWRYRHQASEILQYAAFTRKEKDAILLARLQAIVEHAYKRVPFYRDLYDRHCFTPTDLQKLEDWSQIPIVTRAELQDIPLAHRSSPASGQIEIRSGGTLGRPLEFLIDADAPAREWAHMHHLWRARGYRPTHLKLALRGRHFDRRRVLKYNPVHHELLGNGSCTASEIAAAVCALPERDTVKWVHGFPSLVADFADALTGVGGPAAARVKHGLSGVFLCSEYPAPVYRKSIERGLSKNLLVWYGHSEMTVLAPEIGIERYRSLPSYGFAEGIPDESGSGSHRLLGTSFDNTVHPFIRYDTGDCIDVVESGGGTLTFGMNKGRMGEFVVDRGGHRFSLTSIVFGRDHAILKRVRHLQVKHTAPGRLTFVVTPGGQGADAIDVNNDFDMRGLDFDWDIEVVESPLRTPAGKIRFLVKAA